MFGWNYRTLEGHVERGQMDWEVWKWLDTGEVAFHVHAVSRPASITNPFIRIGFWLLRGHERGVFLDSTDRRMRAFTELGLQRRGPRRGRSATASDSSPRVACPGGIRPTTSSPARSIGRARRRGRIAMNHLPL